MSIAVAAALLVETGIRRRLCNDKEKGGSSERERKRDRNRERENNVK